MCRFADLIRITVVALATMLASASLARAEVSQLFEEAAGVFSQHCVRCHNDDHREGDFSIATEASAVQSDYIQAGDGFSHLLKVILPSDDQPPAMPHEGRPLSPREVEIIRRWIEAGAPWPDQYRIAEEVSDFDWWSFKPIQRPTVPASESDWIRTPIDAFVLSRQRASGISHSPPADRRQLIRRVTYDLTGLPPTPQQIDAFVNHSDPEAYERLVDRLLESKHYGERWARHWLDVVKYADTCGYDKDKLRPNAWPYRDYVIRSLNQDKPYGQFVQEQIAGDAIYPGQPDGILGLGFLAAGPWDFIGHVEVSESKIDGKVARNLDRDDMVTNVLNTFCSVTVQCARCHNHKFDPFTQQHYYSLQSVFAAVDRAERAYDLDPKVDRQRSTLEARLLSLRADRKAVDQEITDAGGDELARLNKQITDLRQKLGVKKQPAFGYHSSIVKDPNVEKWIEVDLGSDVDLKQIILNPCHDDFAGIGAGFGFPVRYRVDVRRDGVAEDETDAWKTVRLVDKDALNPGLKPIDIGAGGQTARYVRVTALKLALRKDDYNFALAELQVLDTAGVNRALQASVSSLDSIEAPVRWARTNLVDGLWAKRLVPEAEESLLEAKSQRAEILARVETRERVDRRTELDESIKNVQGRLGKLPQGKMVYAAATHFKPQGNFKPTGGTPRPVHLLHRGDVQQPRSAVQPGLLPISQDADWQLSGQLTEAERRAALARWLTRKDNPLVWRSIVNRVWQYHFGHGLVSTPNDFGRMGAQPTHPQLLDWLAAEFRDGDQSLKQLHRLIVTSSVYRQSSAYDEAAAAVDAGNRLLWRMNRRRLSAEEIRDSILSVSGVLNETMGGPGFYLFELEKTEHSPHYEYHKFDPADPDSHRRSIYRFIVRSQPDPYMTTLDCADSSQSTPKRIETLTSLQALSLLNNRFNLEMARRFSQRLREQKAENVSAQVDHAMMLVAGRLPDDEERSELEHYAQRHGLENLCRMLFNLSEFVFLD